jgi:hypothetical protein
MIVINQNGQYAFQPGTKLPLTATHPVYRARVAIALPQGAWLYAPAAGHHLSRFARVKQTQAQVDAFQKELLQYLSVYPAHQISRLIAREGVSLNLEIAEGALNV